MYISWYEHGYIVRIPETDEVERNPSTLKPNEDHDMGRWPSHKKLWYTGGMSSYRPLAARTAVSHTGNHYLPRKTRLHLVVLLVCRSCRRDT